MSPFVYERVRVRIPVKFMRYRCYLAWYVCVYVERPEGAVEIGGGAVCFN